MLRTLIQEALRRIAKRFRPDGEAGLAASFSGSRLLSSSLFGIRPYDPSTLAAGGVAQTLRSD
jgi:hypothetical protein